MSFSPASFIGKNIIITGAGRGVGRALCIKLAGELKANVWAVSKNPDNLKSLQSECPTIKTVSLDVTNWEATAEAIGKIGAVDYLVNNAGVIVFKPFLETTAEDFDLCSKTNLRSALNVSQVVAKNMIKAGVAGSIVNVSSLAGIRPVEGACAYSLSKAGLDHLTKIMAVSLGPHKIRVNSINPTGVYTDMLTQAIEYYQQPENQSAAAKVQARSPMPGLVPMDNVVDSVLFCLSDSASMMSGVSIPLDGGFCAT